jgi:hypothetical protein
MSESWKVARASDVCVGDVVRISQGDVVYVSKIETSFLGRANMLAFIEDTPQRWYKRPAAADSEVEIQTSTTA